jgi:hypothetical protein
MPAVIRMRNVDFGMRKKTHLLIPQSAIRTRHSALWSFRILLTHQMSHIVQERDGGILGRLKTIEHRKNVGYFRLVLKGGNLCSLITFNLPKTSS